MVWPSRAAPRISTLNGRVASMTPLASRVSSAPPTARALGPVRRRNGFRPPGVLGRDPGQPVLDHVVADVPVAQLAPHAVQVSHAQAAMVGMVVLASFRSSVSSASGVLLRLCRHETSFRRSAAGATSLCPAQGVAATRSTATPGSGSTPCLGVPVGVPARCGPVDDFGPVRRPGSARSRRGTAPGARRTHRCLWRNVVCGRDEPVDSWCAAAVRRAVPEPRGPGRLVRARGSAVAVAGWVPAVVVGGRLPARLRRPPWPAVPGRPRGCRGPWSRRR